MTPLVTFVISCLLAFVVILVFTTRKDTKGRSLKSRFASKIPLIILVSFSLIAARSIWVCPTIVLPQAPLAMLVLFFAMAFLAWIARPGAWKRDWIRKRATRLDLQLRRFYFSRPTIVTVLLGAGVLLWILTHYGLTLLGVDMSSELYPEDIPQERWWYLVFGVASVVGTLTTILVLLQVRPREEDIDALWLRWKDALAIASESKDEVLLYHLLPNVGQLSMLREKAENLDATQVEGIVTELDDYGRELTKLIERCIEEGSPMIRMAFLPYGESSITPGNEETWSKFVDTFTTKAKSVHGHLALGDPSDKPDAPPLIWFLVRYWIHDQRMSGGTKSLKVGDYATVCARLIVELCKIEKRETERNEKSPIFKIYLLNHYLDSENFDALWDKNKKFPSLVKSYRHAILGQFDASRFKLALTDLSQDFEVVSPIFNGLTEYYGQRR